MFGTTGLNELLVIMLVICVLSMTGLWPRVMRGLRELRGERVPESEARAGGTDVDMCYRLFGLSSSASWDEVERAYRKKAKLHHPDLGGDEDTMRALNEAYSILKGRVKR